MIARKLLSQDKALQRIQVSFFRIDSIMQLFNFGFCTGADARDTEGRPVAFDSYEANSWSLTGAVKLTESLVEELFGSEYCIEEDDPFFKVMETYEGQIKFKEKAVATMIHSLETLRSLSTVLGLKEADIPQIRINPFTPEKSLNLQTMQYLDGSEIPSSLAEAFQSTKILADTSSNSFSLLDDFTVDKDKLPN